MLLGDEVAATQFDGIDRQLACGDIDEALEHERSLRPAGASVRPRRDFRGRDADYLNLGGRDQVAAGQQLRRRQRRDRCRRVQIGAEIGQIARADGEHLAVAVERELRVDVGASALVGGEHVLRSRLGPLHGLAQPDRAQPDQCRLWAGYTLASERSADVRNDDAQLVGRAPQHRRQSH